LPWITFLSGDTIISPRPQLRFLLSHPAHFIALGCGSGLARFAPGTFGTLFGWISFNQLNLFLSPGAWAVVLIGGFMLGVWACDLTGRNLGVSDHGAMVWDEIIAIWLVLLFMPAGLVWQACAFLVFRGFDIFKPMPIPWFEARFKSGFGVMVDDIVAAFYALLLMAVMLRVLA